MTAALRHYGMSGNVGREVGSHADGSYSGTAAAVRHCEGLVQVQVAYVGADEAGVGDADLTVHIGSVHVDLTAVLVDDVADLADLDLEYSVGRIEG